MLMLCTGAVSEPVTCCMVLGPQLADEAEERAAIQQRQLLNDAHLFSSEINGEHWRTIESE